jgi:uncharacterized integral membrane protein (TIGR00697 family)
MTREHDGGRERLFVVLVAVFVTCLVLGDVIGGKAMTTWLGPVSVGMLPFPITFLLTDIVNDFYGRRGAQFLTLVGFAMAALAWVVLQLTAAMPTDPGSYFREDEYARIFGGSAQLFVASMVAYTVGQFLDIYVFQFWKSLTRSRHLWLRATGSTVMSQLVDTIAINAIFWKWTAHKDWPWIVAKIGREYGIKLCVAVALTPVVYALHGIVVRWLKIAPAAAESAKH